ncbi:MAG: HAD family hydrolase [Clostridia bacterium]|nr:HAD family hydrolase [Clostridia bacterium]
MSITAVLFDLDGTLLPMDQDAFTKSYFSNLAAKAATKGYQPDALIDTVWAGTAAMVKNDGEKTNEAVFWELFAAKYGGDALNDIPFFEEFYRTDFQKAKELCGFAPMAKEIIHSLKARGLRVILATNPLFPAIATESRIRWAGLEPEDFELYTTYENSRHCKPNPEYYKDIMAELNLVPEECVMVGNDVTEDMIAETLGMKVFLLTDCLINRKNEDISRYPHGGFNELKVFLDGLE